MARLLFPDAPSVDRVQATAGTALLSASGATARVYLDEAGTQLADILNADSSANATATLILTNESRLPQFYGPTSGAQRLYVRVDGGTALPVDATVDSRLDAQNADITEQLDEFSDEIAATIADADAALAAQIVAQEAAAAAAAASLAPKTYVEVQDDRARSVGLNDFPHTSRVVASYRDDLVPAKHVLIVGNSLAVGANGVGTTNRPGDFLADLFIDAVNPLGNMDLTHDNRAVNGSVLSEMRQKYLDYKVEVGKSPCLVIIVSGMNDFQVAGYHSGQTYSGYITQLRRFLETLRLDGVDAVVYTTPHPHLDRLSWTMPGGISVSYPAAATQVPDSTYAQSVVMVDVETPLNGVVSVPADYRFLRGNQAIRMVCAEYGAIVADAERFWLQALADLVVSTGTGSAAMTALYGGSEVVHPNLTGIQSSYHPAAHAVVDGLRQSEVQSTPTHNLQGSMGVNTTLPAAGLDVVNASSAQPILRLRSAVSWTTGVGGLEAFRVNDDLTASFSAALTAATTLTFGKTTNSTGRSLNVAAATAITIVTLANEEDAEITLTAAQSGIGTLTARVLVQGTAVSTTRHTVTTTLGETGVGAFSIVGRALIFTPAASNSNVYWTLLKRAP